MLGYGINVLSFGGYNRHFTIFGNELNPFHTSLTILTGTVEALVSFLSAGTEGCPDFFSEIKHRQVNHVLKLFGELFGKSKPNTFESMSHAH